MDGTVSILALRLAFYRSTAPLTTIFGILATKFPMEAVTTIVFNQCLCALFISVCCSWWVLCGGACLVVCVLQLCEFCRACSLFSTFVVLLKFVVDLPLFDSDRLCM